MRSLLMVCVVSVTALAACGGQSLTGNTGGSVGSGGAGAGSGGIGGSARATGGTGASALCGALQMEYASAVQAAQTCSAGTTVQCQESVPAALSPCGACPTFVIDASKPNALAQAWQNAGCNAAGALVDCAPIPCPAPRNNLCVPSDAGTGLCSYIPGGTGGSGGAVDGGASTCQSLSAKYAIVLAAAKSCDTGVANQCAQLVPTALSSCGGCQTYVNDAGELKDLQNMWTQMGCPHQAVACPAISCLLPAGGTCMAGDGGAGTCANAYNVF